MIRVVDFAKNVRPIDEERRQLEVGDMCFAADIYDDFITFFCIGQMNKRKRWIWDIALDNAERLQFVEKISQWLEEDNANA